MPYTINFSDPTKINTIVVPDMPPGINTVDTSLNLVGRGYSNYGQKISENFVHLLENFAGPIPPQNPIEGQLWYDTSDPNNKVLRIMDGTAESTRWPSATGIYQQGTDPKETATQRLKVGDIWVDIANNQLKIFNSNNWTLVGPPSSYDTGSEPSVIQDLNGNNRSVILNKVDGTVVSIIANEQFTPKIVINGFSLLKPGINISNAAEQNQPDPVLNGVSVAAKSLIDSAGDYYDADLFLRKNDQSSRGQIIEGVVRFQTPSTNNTITGQGRDGIVINNSSLLSDTNYIQFYKGDNNAILLNNTPNGSMVFKVKGNSLSTILELSKDGAILSGSVTVSQTLSVANTLTVLSTASTSISTLGGVDINKGLRVVGDLRISGKSTFTGLVNVSNDIVPDNNGTQSLGSITKKFKQIYADVLGTTGSIFIGTFDGLARGLQQSTEFRIQGQVTGTTVSYNGTSIESTFSTTLTPAAIADQTIINTSSSSLSLLVLNTATTTLGQITRDNFLSNVFPTGMIIAYGTNTNIPPGWLLCDGSPYSQTGEFSGLYNLITTTYGSSSPGYFNVPDMRQSTTATNTTTFISYIIKT